MVQKSLEPIVAAASQCIRGAIHFQFLSILEVTEPYIWLWWLTLVPKGQSDDDANVVSGILRIKLPRLSRGFIKS